MGQLVYLNYIQWEHKKIKCLFYLESVGYRVSLFIYVN